MTRAALALALVLATACERGELPLLAAASPPSPPAEIDPRSPRDLAGALAAVEADDAAGYAEVVRSFRGRRYRWPLYLVAPLCRPDRCNVLAFERIGREHGVVQGWLPRLEIESGQRARLLERCAGQSPCRFVAEVRLAELVASPERFTSVTLDEVDIDIGRRP